MTDRTQAYRVVDAPRSVDGREWEVFVRESTDEPLHHAGSVSAPSPAVAREQATTLFDRAATDLWLCPADEVERLSTRTLADRGEGRIDGDVRRNASHGPGTGVGDGSGGDRDGERECR